MMEKIKYIIMSVLMLTTSIILTAAPMRGGFRPHSCKASPPPRVHYHNPPCRVAPPLYRFAYCPPPRRIHGEWVAVGGVSYLMGSIIRACSYSPVVTTTYVTHPSQSVIVQQPTVVVRQSSVSISTDTLRSDLHAELSASMVGIPYSIQINSLDKSGDMLIANITTTVSINGKNYNITSGCKGNTYLSLKTNLTNEIINAVDSLRVGTTITTAG